MNRLAKKFIVAIVLLGLLGGGEIPVAYNIKLRRHLVDNGTPLPFEVQSGTWSDLPVAAEQTLAFEQRQRGMPKVPDGDFLFQPTNVAPLGTMPVEGGGAPGSD